MIFNKLRRRQSSSLPLRASHPPSSYVHHASTPPEWPTTPTQATPDVYITSPPEEDGLQTSVCVHRAVEHEPKKLRKQEERRISAPVEMDVNDLDGEPQSPPAFRRSSLPTPDLVMPKKPSEFGPAKWTQILNRQSVADKGTQERVESSATASGPEPSSTEHVQWDGGHQLTRVSSSRDMVEEPASTLVVPKQKDTLRRRASKVFKSFTNRESLTFGSSSTDKAESRANGSQQQKRRNTLSDGSRPFGVWMKAATAHAIPSSSVDDSAASPPKTSAEGRRRSSTIARVEGITRSTSPPLPLPLPQEASAKDLPTVSAAHSAASEAVLPLEPPLEISEPTSKATSDAPKSRKLQNKRSKGTFSHLFGLKGEKQFRSPPPAKQEDAPIPPVPVIPQELVKAVADPDTPEIPQTPTFTSPGSAVTPKSTKSKRFLRHRRRATIGSISTPAGTPSTLTTPDTPKTPSSLRSRPFSIIDLRKGFSMRSLGKNKGKLMSAKSSPVTPPVPKLPKNEEREPPATVMHRYKMSRPPPLQPSDSSLENEDPPVPLTASTMIVSPMTVDFNEMAEAVETVMSSPTDSEGPVTPMFSAMAQSAPALVPAVDVGESKHHEEPTPELSFTPPTSEDGDQSTHRPSAASETTLAVDDPLFGALDRPSTLGDLQLQLHEPSTKTSTLDAHLKLDSLRFDSFAFDAGVF
ncbi:hypothetical protein FRC12_010853 [Ceratobasidium sp. 428]|nr:hypothetical protein FRC12_010853 [Ceratobasidium sp. 428]